MAHPIKELANLTCKSKQIDGMGFGGIAADRLQVAGALGMRNPNTGKKIQREAYNLARFVYCMDMSHRHSVKASLLQAIKPESGKVKETTLLAIVRASLHEFIQPHTKLNKNGEPEPAELSNKALAERIGIDPTSMTDKHEYLYRKCLEVIWYWSSDAIQHINLCLESEAA